LIDEGSNKTVERKKERESVRKKILAVPSQDSKKVFSAAGDKVN